MLTEFYASPSPYSNVPYAKALVMYLRPPPLPATFLNEQPIDLFHSFQPIYR